MNPDIQKSNSPTEYVYGKIKHKQRLAEEIVTQIKEAIFEGKLRPGDKLPTEKHFAELSGTSRTTAREAIRCLELSGLLVVKPGQGGGAFVTLPDISRVQSILSDLVRAGRVTIEHFTEVRILLEPIIADIIVKNITKEDIERLDENVRNAKEELQKAKPRSVSLNIKFHKILVECTKNPLLIILSNLLFDFFATYLKALQPAKVIAESVVSSHEEIVKKIRDGDFDGVRQAMIDHVRDINKRLL